MNQISFTARFVKNTTVKKLDKATGDYKDKKVAIVELDQKDEKDLDSLSKISKNWNINGGVFVGCIYGDAKKNKLPEDVIKEHYYAITTQRGGYKNLNPKKVLGLNMFSEMNAPYDDLTWLETKPTTSVKISSARKYKNIGSAMIDFLTKEYSQKPIHVYSAEDAIMFYRNNGFTHRFGDTRSDLYYEA